MKCRYIVFVLFSLTSCLCDELVQKNWQDWKSRQIDDYDRYVGNPDDDAIIVRPCYVYDLRCIRKFFSEHAKCNIAHGPLPDPLFRSQVTNYIPRINVSSIVTNINITGLKNSRIEEFYINKRTDKLVIAIEFRNLNLSSPSVYYKFFRTGREPVITVADSFIVWTSVTITAIIPNIDDLQLDNAEITAFSQDAFPPFYIGPSLAESSDPQVQASLTEMLTDVPTALQEIMLTEAPYFPPIYIQSNICDFGFKVL